MIPSREPCMLGPGRDFRENGEIASGTPFRNHARSAVSPEILFGSARPTEISAERHPYIILVTETLPGTPPRRHVRSRSGVKSGAKWSPRTSRSSNLFLETFCSQLDMLSNSAKSHENGHRPGASRSDNLCFGTFC